MKLHKLKGSLLMTIPLFTMTCNNFKFDPDANCFNPGSSCFVKDTQAPTLASSVPAAAGTVQQNSDIQTVVFSEPVNGGDKPSSYAFSGVGGANIVVSVATKVDDRTYQLTISGGLITGAVVLSFPGITDWAGNAVQGTLSFTASVGIVVTPAPSGQPAGKFYVSNTAGGNLTQNITWQSDTVAEQYFVNIVPFASPCPAAPSSSNSTGTGNSGVVGTVNSNITTQIKAADMAGVGDYNICIFVNKTSLPLKTGSGSVVFTRDDSKPVISAVAPATSAAVNNTVVSYTVSEACATGSVTWTRTGGTADGTSPHVQALTGTELDTGAHSGITLTNNPTLVSGAIYSVAFGCIDLSLNAAVTVTSTNVTYDTTVPVVSNVTSSTTDGTYGSTSAVSIQVAFSKTVNVTGTPQLTIATGTPATTVLNYVSGSGTSMLTFTYTIVAGNSAADLDYANAASLSFNGGTIQDTAGNSATLTLANPGAAGSLGANKNLVIDTTPAFVSSVTSATANGSYGLGQTVAIQVVFNKAVNVSGTPQLTLTTTSPATTAVNYVSGTGTNTLLFNYTTAAGNSSADLDYASTGALSAGGGIATADGAAVLTLASPGAAGSLGANKNFVVDATAPSPGAVGALGFASVTTSGLTVSWTNATDNLDAQTSLQYLLYYSTANNISSVANAQANGTAVGTYATDIATQNVTGLTTGATYYFNVLVKDSNGNIAAYTSAPATVAFWTPQTLATSQSWNSITYGSGTFVAVATGGSSISGTSPDGVTWTPRTMPSSQQWYSTAFGGSVFVAVARSSSVAASSPDGITWTSRSLIVSQLWNSVTYGGGVFVAVAMGPTTSAASSPDGITWTPRSMANDNWGSVTYGGGVFLAVADGGSTASATSPDGVTWTAHTMPLAASWTVTYGTQFVAIVNGGGTAYTSPDGITWTLRTMPTTANWASATYGGGQYVAVAAGSPDSASSPDGISWTLRTLPSATSWKSVTFGGTKFVTIAIGTTAASSP